MRMPAQERAKHLVATGEQSFAECFESLLGGHFAPVCRIVAAEGRARGCESLVFVATHQLGQELQLPFARHRRGDAAHVGDLGAHVLGQLDPGEARGRQRHQGLAQIEQGQRVASALAAAGSGG